MGILCKMFGHREMGYYRDGAPYGKVRGGQADGTGRLHYQVELKCDRCGATFIGARFHGPLSQSTEREAGHE